MDRLRLLVVSLLFGAGPPAAFAEVPRVQFDLPYAIACRDVSPPGFLSANPGLKLMEVRLEISSLLTAGQEKDLTQYFIRIDNPQQSLTVVDYLPKTLHESRLAGPVTIQNGKEKSATLGINLSGKYEPLTAGASAGIGQKKTSSVKYDLLPPLESVAASGTLLRGSAVFFKLKSTPRHLLEGSRQFALVLQVPAAWRADVLRVRCEAEGVQHSLVSTFDEQVSAGQREFLVALFLEGDEQARQMADGFVHRDAASAGATKARNSKGPGQRSDNPGRTPAPANWTLRLPPIDLMQR
jgi:hypothetical protein